MVRVFYLGVHEPSWMTRTTHPLFVSYTRLKNRRSPIAATCQWILDSGSFTQIDRIGYHEMTPECYAERVTHINGLIPGMVGAIPQDYMCEPHMLSKTGLTIRQHQDLTTTNYLRSLAAAPALPWVPVLQGWILSDYLDHLNQYVASGVDLTQLPLVGVGSMCKRQHMLQATEILQALARHDLQIHAFGFKATGLTLASSSIVSADSMAWSYAARRADPLPGHTHKNCANCLDYALGWARRLEVRWKATTPNLTPAAPAVSEASLLRLPGSWKPGS